MIERITVYYDGVVGPTNQGPNAAIGFVVLFNDDVYGQGSGFEEKNGNITDVVAEYQALIHALQYVLHKNRQKGHVRFYGDSPMIVNHMNGVWDVAPEYALWYSQAKNLARKFEDIGFSLVPRDQTKAARDLAETEFVNRGVEYADLHYAKLKKAAKS
jgi:Ribonuclease HI